MRARRAKIKGVAASRSEALSMVGEAGDLAVVDRGKLRAVVIQCPDGCGEKLTVNLDPDAGKSWRLYRERDRYTLYPSVWRTTGCRSHFIVWSDQIYWMDWRDSRPSSASLISVKSAVNDLVLPETWISVEQLAADIEENPWLIARACEILCREGVIEESDEGDSYRRRLPNINE